MKVNITPKIRFHIAYASGCIAAVAPVLLLQSLNSEEPSRIWLFWTVLFVVNIFIYAWNYNEFTKETLWMTIKNPAKVTYEEGDIVNRVTIRPIKPPPAPKPRTTRHTAKTLGD